MNIGKSCIEGGAAASGYVVAFCTLNQHACSMKLLGHKRIESTMLYTQLIEFSDHECSCKVADSVEEAKALVEAGFEYVTAFEGHMLFRKRA